jgi:hypothetical protein
VVGASDEKAWAAFHPLHTKKSPHPICHRRSASSSCANVLMCSCQWRIEIMDNTCTITYQRGIVNTLL